MSKADLHIHTRVSDGMASVERVLEYVQDHTGLDVIGITDHEDATGGLRARELAAKRGYRFEVVVGAEVTTMQGHLLGLFIESAPKSFRRVESALEMIHAQGGLAVIPHPMSWLTRSLSERTIERVTARGEASVGFDAIEVANPSPAGKATVRKARRLNAGRWHFAETGGSDAHHLPHIGTGWTEFEGKGAEALKQSIANKTTMARMASYPSMREVGFGQVALGLAWGYAATPRKMLSWRANRGGGSR
jgi:predicted metal-dependent phosphoesterase TrpH